MSDVCVYLGRPGYGLPCGESVDAAWQASKRGLKIEMSKPDSCSLLACGFNKLWAAALQNRKYTHFAMLHSDVAPDAGWLDVLMEEMNRLRFSGQACDLISVVSPIKDDRGLTSCGIGNPAEIWWSPKRRFTMTEIAKLPETFDAAAAGYPGEPLLVNTACWLADIRNPKWMEADEQGWLKFCFSISDGIRVHEHTSDLTVCVMPEDWYASVTAHHMGLKFWNTRKVHLIHKGGRDYDNQAVWGQEVDQDTKPFWSTNAA